MMVARKKVKINYFIIECNKLSLFSKYQCYSQCTSVALCSACVSSIISIHQTICFIFEISGEHLKKSLTLKSAEVILMTVFEERTLRDVKLHQQILPACRFLKVSGVRGHSKPTVTKKLAKALIDRGYVVISSENLANLQISDVNVSSDKDIKEDIKEMARSKQGKITLSD